MRCFSIQEVVTRVENVVYFVAKKIASPEKNICCFSLSPYRRYVKTRLTSRKVTLLPKEFVLT